MATPCCSYKFNLPNSTSFTYLLPLPPSNPRTSLPRLNVETNDSLGHVLWPASLFLSFFLANNPHLFISTSPTFFPTVVELGGGAGAVSCSLRQSLSTHTLPISDCDDEAVGPHQQHFHSNILLTDGYAGVVTQAQRAIELNFPQEPTCPSKITAQSYQWGALSLPSEISSRSSPPTLYIGSDVFFAAHCAYPLARTIYQTQSIHIISYQHRDGQIKTNLSMLLKKFNLQLHILWSNNPATITYLSRSHNANNLTASSIHYELALTIHGQQEEEEDAIGEQDQDVAHHAVTPTPHFTLTLQPELLNNWSDYVMYQYHTTKSRIPNQHAQERQEEEGGQEQHDRSAPKWQNVQDNAELELWVIYPQQKYAIIPQNWF